MNLRPRLFFYVLLLLDPHPFYYNQINRFPNGMGNDSGELGHNLMDHHFKAGANGKYEDLKIDITQGEGLVVSIFLNSEIGGSTTHKDFLEVTISRWSQ